MVNFRGKQYPDERAVILELMDENRKLQIKVEEQEEILRSFRIVAKFLKGEVKI